MGEKERDKRREREREKSEWEKERGRPGKGPLMVCVPFIELVIWRKISLQLSLFLLFSLSLLSLSLVFFLSLFSLSLSCFLSLSFPFLLFSLSLSLFSLNSFVIFPSYFFLINFHVIHFYSHGGREKIREKK